MDWQHGEGFKIRQRKELAELFGYESRNKYEITMLNGKAFGFAVEDGRSLSAILLRQILGHWRTFGIQFYDFNREPAFRAFHPFRWFFHRLEVRDPSGQLIGALQKKFSILTKKFHLEDGRGRVLFSVSSPFWRIWTFEFKNISGKTSATIKKKWSGLLTEAVLDADNFVLYFNDPNLLEDCKNTLLAATIFIDLIYFEEKAY